MKALIKFFGILLAIFLLVVWFFFDNIKGYYTFKEYCEKEGGLTVYEPLEKNVGWWAKDRYDAKVIANIKNVGFSRFKDTKDEKNYDVIFIAGEPIQDSSYKVIDEISDNDTTYQWISDWKYVDESKRLKMSFLKVLDKNNKELVVHKIFYFSPYGGALGGPDWIVCDNKKVKPNNWKQEFISAFKTE